MSSAVMAENESQNGRPRCAELEARVAAQEALVDSLQAALAKAREHSGNYYKLPSSDIVKPRRKLGDRGVPGKSPAGPGSASTQLVGDATRRAPLSREAYKLARLVREYSDSYSCFNTELNVEPTNNLAEQPIRLVAIHRRITQGTRSEDGRRWCEHIWTVMQEYSQPSRSVFEF